MKTKNYDKKKTGRALTVLYMQIKSLLKFGELSYNQRKCIHNAYALISMVDREVFLELQAIDNEDGV